MFDPSTGSESIWILLSRLSLKMSDSSWKWDEYRFWLFYSNCVVNSYVCMLIIFWYIKGIYNFFPFIFDNFNYKKGDLVTLYLQFRLTMVNENIICKKMFCGIKEKDKEIYWCHISRMCQKTPQLQTMVWNNLQMWLGNLY